MRLATWICLPICALAATPGRVAAYADANFFAFAASAGGSGGRYFTGSLGDSYTCSSCHAGGLPPAIHVLGLPLAGYRPFSRYEITIDWSDDFPHMGAVAEVTDVNGRRAGTVRLPHGDEVQDPELCAAVTSLAADVIAVPPPDNFAPSYCGDDFERMPKDCRQVVHVRDCGAQRLRFLWTAPGSDAGPLWFSGSAVAVDGDSTNRGDGVTDFSHTIGAPKSDSDAMTMSTECGVRRVGSHRGPRGWVGLIGLLALRRLRWVRIKRSRGNPFAA